MPSRRYTDYAAGVTDIPQWQGRKSIASEADDKITRKPS